MESTARAAIDARDGRESENGIKGQLGTQWTRQRPGEKEPEPRMGERAASFSRSSGAGREWAPVEMKISHSSAGEERRRGERSEKTLSDAEDEERVDGVSAMSFFLSYCQAHRLFAPFEPVRDLFRNSSGDTGYFLRKHLRSSSGFLFIAVEEKQLRSHEDGLGLEMPAEYRLLPAVTVRLLWDPKV
ncbi:hypothetical protein PO909_003987 [Leuciscus waleckii]